ncbi:hematopoietic cell signal transducer isoform X1 [Rousettus aegyptiacus]|uniref:hematopoietic cell signal transducer isoform X1 n=1 Tax=Rousettus aegyptiacus TaxID=9407 RepID=UPI00168D01AC|nr:hematopoietic cell signal transducer isoform X1 [Rousettus aegyptiacus]
MRALAALSSGSVARGCWRPRLLGPGLGVEVRAIFLDPGVATAQIIPASCSGCGPLSLPLLVGLVATDAVVSLLIVAVVFVCARLRSRPTQGDGKIYINMPGRG